MGYIRIPDSLNASKIWFTADQHFGHANIIKFADRPFESVEAMDAALIKQWNTYVAPSDYVFHLGDFTLNGPDFADAIFKQLNGRIHVLGTEWHHDRRWLAPIFQKIWLSDFEYTGAHWPVEIMASQAVLEVPQIALNKRPLIIHLNHYPMSSWDRSHYGAWHLYGHVHQYQNREPDTYKCNVGVDVWPYRPINLLIIKKFMETKGWPISPLSRINNLDQGHV